MEFSNAIGNNFIVMVSALPNFEGFVTDITIPDVNIMAANVAGPMKDFMQHGDKVEFDPISIGYTVDEGFFNWEEIYRWTRGQQNPELMHLSETPKTDITVMLLSNNKNPLLKLTFKDCFPETCSGFTLASTDSGKETLTSSSTWRFLDMEFERVGNYDSPYDRKNHIPAL